MYTAKILLDSLAPCGARLTTFEVTFPHVVLAEFNTHRMLCLAGDSELEFDLPGGGNWRRVYRMSIADFVDKWYNGARRTGANPKREANLTKIEDRDMYSATELSGMCGFVSASNLNSLCRSGDIPALKASDGRTWLVRGADFKAWRSEKPEHTRFDMRVRLASMRIRQVNEDTQHIQCSHVVNCHESGKKDVWDVIAGGFKVGGSANHLVLTDSGWKSISDICPRIDSIAVRRFGKIDIDLSDQSRLRLFDGKWRTVWQREIRAKMRTESPACRRCGVREGMEIHHIIPVYKDPSRALDDTNVTLLCDQCHKKMHQEQDWQGGTYLYADYEMVTDIRKRGVLSTFDLEIAGKYPNFIANGVVVHNSRNSASSRAIPVEKMLKRVEEDPFVPIHWGKNQRGMQADQELTSDEQERSLSQWLSARDEALHRARALAEIGVHKQVTNRLLEPFLWHPVIVSATEWDNFFALRCHPAAMPEIRRIAEMMRDLHHASQPTRLGAGDWHLPLVSDEDRALVRARHEHKNMDFVHGRTWDDDLLKKVSAGRCARVSYLTHDGKRDLDEDVALCDRLAASGHMSPLEHVAEAQPLSERCGNFVGWKQFRKEFSNEAVFISGVTR